MANPIPHAHPVVSSQRPPWRIEIKNWLPTSSGHALDSVDGLRGIAILLVVAFHILCFRGHGSPFITIPGMLARGGWVGVDLFFVISGCLISKPFLKAQINKRQVDLKKYGIRRLGKIAPPYYLAIALAAIKVYLLENSTDLAANVARDSLFYYAIADIPSSLLSVLWSLGVEVKFYLILPLLFLCCRRLSFDLAAWIIILFFLLVPASVAGLVTTFNAPILAFVHAWVPLSARDFSWGIAFAYLSVRVPEKLLRQVAPWLFCLGVILISALCLEIGVHSLDFDVRDLGSYRASFEHSSWFPSALGFACFLLLFATVKPPKIAGRLLNSSWLMLFGIISYEWYLFHTIISFSGYASGSILRWMMGSLIPCLISLLLAAVVYRFYSLPILTKVHRNR